MKILVVDDHPLVRDGLHQVLRGLEENVEVLEAGTCTQSFDIAQTHPDLDLVLLDYNLPDMTGLDALSVFGTKHPELPILMLSGSVNLAIIRKVLLAGAAGFVTKSSRSDELLNAVQRVLDGEVYLPQELNAMPGQLADTSNAEIAALTKRQDLVLRQMLNGQTNREISQHLGISEETVKNHVTAVLRHFDVQNRTQAVVAAARSGYKT